MTRAELVKQIKASRLYELYHNPTDEIDRKAPEGVNASGQATDRMMALQRMIKVATTRETDFPPELRNDADELRELIQTGIVTLFAEAENGEITAEAFKQVFTPLAGMTEGMLEALHHDDPEKMYSLRSMKTECVDKAFYRQLKKVLRESDHGGTFDRARAIALGKALSSFSTHLFIGAERSGHLPSGLIEEVQGIVTKLSRKAARGNWDYGPELSQVRSWGLVEDAGMAPVTRGYMATNSSKQFSGLPKGRNTPNLPPGSAETKGPDNDETSYKSGGGEKAKVTPPQLDQAPGNPKNVDDGTDAKQDGKWMDGGLSDTIDGQKSNQPVKESVEFSVRIPKNVGLMEWNIRTGDKLIGEAWKRVFLGGSELKAKIHASELATALREADGIPGDGVEVTASDIFSLQVKVVEEMNKVAAKLGQKRRFVIGR